MNKPRVYKSGRRWIVSFGERAVDKYEGFATWGRAIEFVRWTWKWRSLM